MVLGPWAGSLFSFGLVKCPDQSPLPSGASSVISSPLPLHGDGSGGGNADASRVLKKEHSEMEVFSGSDGEDEAELKRPPYIHAMLAGGIGGTTGDMLMHSIDTVKTRQQGDPRVPPKYSSMGPSYLTILREEGIRGLYGGVSPAFLGSFCGTVLFFGGYEWSKRQMLDHGVTPSIAYLVGGLVADLIASPIYVPSEVLKTRLQLQGRCNNPYFYSGYNYRSFPNAIATIYRTEGLSALFHGYKATLVRDLPFSALQFAFYEQERGLAKRLVGSNDIGLPLEIVTGASAGGLAGVITCPLDVVKTRVQTQKSKGGVPESASSSERAKGLWSGGRPPTTLSAHPTIPSSLSAASSPAKILTPGSSASMLDTSSVFTGLRMIYQSEGLSGWFRGVGPRAVWTSVQSGTMLVMYQALLRQLESRSFLTAEANA